MSNLIWAAKDGELQVVLSMLDGGQDVNFQTKVWVYIDVLILLGWLHCNYAGKRDSRG